MEKISRYLERQQGVSPIRPAKTDIYARPSSRGRPCRRSDRGAGPHRGRARSLASGSSCLPKRCARG
jgi:hypothetical protein